MEENEAFGKRKKQALAMLRYPSCNSTPALEKILDHPTNACGYEGTNATLNMRDLRVQTQHWT